jgi:D-xylose transport system ATP-binding protein
MSPVLSARNLTKRFPGVVALKDVSFDLHEGEIHALCGENGAGKSTLIKLLSGLHSHGSYEGELLVGDKTARFRGIADAERAGLAVIYQELALVEEMTVAENIFLGREPRRFGLVDWERMHCEAQALLRRFQIELSPGTPVSRLGVGEKQLVEIVKALGKNSRILILDEPTAALAEHETQILLNILRDLRGRGIACIYISHRLDEVFAIADRITVLRDGETVFTAKATQTNKSELIRHMVGREITELFPRALKMNAVAEHQALYVENLSVADPHTGVLRLSNITFSIAPGEVLGIGGLMGAGRTELLMHLYGAWGTRVGGRVAIGRRLLPGSPPETLRSGLALVSEDRRRQGLVLEQNVGFNLSLSSLARLSCCGLIQPTREHSLNDAFFCRLGVRATELEATAGKLSGGNQQKIVLGKALMTEPKVILLDEPTRGIDVGAKAEIYGLINNLTASGKAVVLVSSELPELIGMSDRILMLHEGRIAGEFERGATQEQLLAAAMGGEIEDATPAPPSQPGVFTTPRMNDDIYIAPLQFFLPIL